MVHLKIRPKSPKPELNASEEHSIFTMSDSNAKDTSTSTNTTGEDVKNKEEKRDVKKPITPVLVGKRRGGRILPTGVVKKPKVEEPPIVDAASRYLAEVRRYEEKLCSQDPSKRPLVK